MKYSEPVSQLFSLDYPGEENVLDYKSLGITTEHNGELRCNVSIGATIKRTCFCIET